MIARDGLRKGTSPPTVQIVVSPCVVGAGAEPAESHQQLRPSAEEFSALAKGWLAVRRLLLLEERRAGNLSEEVMHELIAAMDAEELALDTRIALRT